MRVGAYRSRGVRIRAHDCTMDVCSTIQIVTAAGSRACVQLRCRRLMRNAAQECKIKAKALNELAKQFKKTHPEGTWNIKYEPRFGEMSLCRRVGLSMTQDARRHTARTHRNSQRFCNKFGWCKIVHQVGARWLKTDDGTPDDKKSKFVAMRLRPDVRSQFPGGSIVRSTFANRRVLSEIYWPRVRPN